MTLVALEQSLPSPVLERPRVHVQIFRFSVWSGKPTPGAALMNLRFRDERGAGASAAAAPASEVAGAAGGGSRPAVAAAVRPGSTKAHRLSSWVFQMVVHLLNGAAGLSVRIGAWR